MVSSQASRRGRRQCVGCTRSLTSSPAPTSAPWSASSSTWSGTLGLSRFRQKQDGQASFPPEQLRLFHLLCLSGGGHRAVSPRDVVLMNDLCCALDTFDSYSSVVPLTTAGTGSGVERAGVALGMSEMSWSLSFSLKVRLHYRNIISSLRPWPCARGAVEVPPPLTCLLIPIFSGLPSKKRPTACQPMPWPLCLLPASSAAPTQQTHCRASRTSAKPPRKSLGLGEPAPPPRNRSHLGNP